MAHTALTAIAVTALLLFLVPWIFWSLAYGAFNLLRHRPLWPAELDPVSGLLYGTSAHLWFMPFMFAVLLLLGFAKARMAPAAMFWTSLAVALALLLAAPVVRPWSLALGPPYAQWVHAAAPVFAGIVMGLAGSVRHGRWGGAALALGLAVATLYGIRGISVAYPVGALLQYGVAWILEHVSAYDLMCRCSYAVTCRFSASG